MATGNLVVGPNNNTSLYNQFGVPIPTQQNLNIPGNLNVGGTITGNGNITTNSYFIGNGAFLTGITTTTNAIVNGTSIVSIPIANGPVWGNIGGTPVFTVDADGISTVGVNGNIQGPNVVQANTFVGSGNLLDMTGFSGHVIPLNDNVYTLGNATKRWESIFVSGNVAANSFVGNGRALTGIISSYGDANVEAYLPSSPTIINLTANVANLSNTTANNSANITNLQNQVYTDANVQSYLASNSSVTLTTTGQIKTTANVQGQYILGNAAFLTGLPVSYGNANVTNLLASGNVASNIVTTGNVVGLAFRTSALNISNTVISSSQDIILDPVGDLGQTGTVTILGNLDVVGNVTYITSTTTTTNSLLWQAANNASSANIANGGGLAVGPGGNSYATFTYGSIANQWNTNIPLAVAGNLSATGNVSGQYFLGNVAFATGFPSSDYGNSNVATLLASGTLTSNIITSGNVSGTYILGDGSELTNVSVDFTNVASNINPSVSNTYAIGNATNQWASIDVNYANANVLNTNTFYIGNTLFTRTLTVGTRTLPVTVPLASNNSFNVVGRSGNINVLTT